MIYVCALVLLLLVHLRKHTCQQIAKFRLGYENRVGVWHGAMGQFRGIKLMDLDIELFLMQEDYLSIFHCILFNCLLKNICTMEGTLE